MPKHRKEIAVQVAKSLYASEDSIDAAIAQVSRFVGEMPQARQEARFAACVGQDALSHAITAMSALATARQAMIAAHEALAQVQEQFNLGPLAFGVPINKPSYPFAQLRAVETAAA
jgi:hypothetical protein